MAEAEDVITDAALHATKFVQGTVATTPSPHAGQCPSSRWQTSHNASIC